MTRGYTVKTEDEIEHILIQTKKTFESFTDEVQLQKQADYYKALGDPIRLKLIAFISEEPSCLCELRDAFDIPNSTLTHHLKLLERGGILLTEKRGKYTIFRLTDDSVKERI